MIPDGNKLIIIPLFELYGWPHSWLAYPIVFIIAFNALLSGATEHKAYEKIAYGDALSQKKFCTQCGQGIEKSSIYSSACGTKQVEGG